jgi:class 3 adenylate cyclase
LQLDAADLRNVPRDIQKRTGAVLVLDLVKSTWMVGNVDLRDSGEIFDDFVSTVARIVHENGGHFDKFTGDGLLAEFFADGEDEPSRQSAARSAYECAKSLVVNIGNFFQREPWRSLLVDAALTGSKTRVAISWGPVHFGRYCGVGTAVGSPMIQAARLCAAKEFFSATQQAQTAYSVIGTSPVFELAHLPVKEAAERQIARDWPIEGLGPVTVFGLYP